MLISHSHRFIFIHVGKTGGMSMREVLRPICEEPEKFRMRRPPKLIRERPNPLYTAWETLLLHAKARDVQREIPAETFRSFYKFAFVRNPWDLQVSMYHFILRDPEVPRHEEVKALGGFDQFVEWVVTERQPYPKGITKLQSEMIVDLQGRPTMDFVGRYETLSADFTHVARVLGLTAPLPHKNQSLHRDYRTYYNSHTPATGGRSFSERYRVVRLYLRWNRPPQCVLRGVRTVSAERKMNTKVNAVFEARTPDELAARYDQWAQSYDEDMGDHGGPMEAVDTLSRYVAPGARILDAGCGTGPGGIAAGRIRI